MTRQDAKLFQSGISPKVGKNLHYMRLRLQSSAWAYNPSRQDHIICI